MKIPASVLCAVMLVAAPSLAQDAQPQPQALGGAGESCRARSDCKGGLRCVSQICTDEHEGQQCGATSDCGGELRCINNKCTTPNAAGKPAGGGAAGGGGSGDASMDAWMKFKLDDGTLHPFVGLTFSGGPVLGAIGANGQFQQLGNTQGAFLFGLNGGFVAGPHELSLELSPFTYFYAPNTGGPTFQFNVSYHYLIKLYENESLQVFYPIGIGAGLFTGNTASNVYFQARADLIGVMFKIGHVLVDVSLPSFRYGVTSQSVGTLSANFDIFTWLFGASLGYAF
jgi:hypothetical protein